MKTKLIGGLLVAMFAVSTAAEAQTRTPVINGRESYQKARIRQGERSGQLTHAEARNLARRENSLQRQKMIAKSNGYVSPAERAHLQRKENRISRAIYRKKHNYRHY
ncbi:hypothetical protein [Mucilaginibacter ginkgonis]|uniref:Uncharacterized protein n=1 Tax=Mucilaginibacter ginkgonis TaxID=2682091 RepID=A0A6I4IPH8_9SPHI|nr:hypothetical protein [Mucilaginibacter ginkgonis]QQL49161.1 hypothetical protein GO620_013385 [Mucilaginibacter ginkgonis]